MAEDSQKVMLEGVKDPTIGRIIELVPQAKDPVVVEALLQDKALRESLKVAVPKRVPRWLRMWSRVKAVVMLWILFAIALPLTMAGMIAALAYHLSTGKSASHRGPPPGTRGTALVSGGNKGKALAVVRHLHRAGWRVVLVEVQTGWGCGTRFSNCVSAFYSTPRPNTDPLGYLQAVRDIAAKEGVHLWVPVSMAQYSVYEALASHLMPRGTISCTTDPHMTALVNDKNLFTKFAKQHGLAVPEAFPVTSKDQLRDYNRRASKLFAGKRFLLKSVAYDAISRADLFTLPCDPKVLDNYIRQYEMSPSRPWLLQQFLQGPEYSCYTIAHKGRIVAHVDNMAELSCLNYQHVGVKQILIWAENFCRKTGASGQLCFDFMYDRPGGKMYCIECNPRTSTNLMAFYNHPGFARAYFEPEQLIEEGKAPLLPLESSKQSYWIWNEIGKVFLGEVRSIRGLQQLPKRLGDLIETLRSGRDAVFDAKDPLPFLALHFLQEPLNLLRIVQLGTPWLKLDLCSGKVVELGGD